MKELITRLMKEEEGATIIEYVLLAALISVIAIAAITSIGGKVSGGYDKVDNSLTGAP